MIDKFFFKKVVEKLLKVNFNKSYSQTGEDLIINFLLQSKAINNFSYLDIGANDPISMNNTYKFYTQGFHGVCIEPDPYIFKKLLKKRSKDICLNIGLTATKNTVEKMYLFEDSTFNTFDESKAENLISIYKCKLKEIKNIEVTHIDKIINKYFSNKVPDFISIDIEGLDEAILRSLSFDKYRPSIFCLETVKFSPDASGAKRDEIFSFMKEKNYWIFADTYLNTIFIDGLKWPK